MKKVLKLTAFILAAFALLSLAACDGANVLKVYNWNDYIADDVIKDFTKETGIRVIYDGFDENEKMFVKVKSGGNNNYDVVVPSDYMIEQMIAEDMLEELDFSNIPNYGFIMNKYRNLGFDPDNKYSVPYMTGTLGILYNKKLVNEPITSLHSLFDARYAGKIFMMESMRDTLGTALKLLGYSYNTTNEDQINQAAQILMAQKPLVLGYVNDTVKDGMISGEALLALVYSGEAFKVIDEYPDEFEYIIPDEGTNLAVDSFVIIKGSKNKEAAEKFINFMQRPDIALRNALETGYITPNSEVLKELPREWIENNHRYPNDSTLAEKAEYFNYSPVKTELFNRAWSSLKVD